MHRLKHALALARRARICPTPEILRDPTHQGNILAHQAICPHCRHDTGEEAAAWMALSNALNATIPAAGHREDAVPVRAGDLRYIRPDLARWRDGNYYSPPLVLVLGQNQDVPGACLVAQACNAPVLAGPGDLILTRKRTAFYETIFIEPWNRYTMKNNYLGAVVGRVDPSVIEHILRLDENPGDPPAGFPAPRPMGRNDPRIDFRKLEIEVGYTFASAAVSAIMDQMDAPATADADLGKAVALLTARRPGIVFAKDSEGPLEMLMHAGAADDAYAVAAAGDDGDEETFSANLVVFTQGEPTEFRPVSMTIDFRQCSGNDLTLTGSVADLPRDMARTELYMQLVFSQGRKVDAHQAYLLADENLFVAKFSDLPEGPFRPRGLIVGTRLSR